MDIPPPHRLYQLEVAEPSRRASCSRREVVAPAVPGPCPRRPEPPPATVPWKGGQIAFDRFLELTHTNAFVILRDGKLAYEWYRPGVDARARRCPRGPCPSHCPLLVGQAIARGKLRESDRLVDLLPELKTGGDYDKVTVRDLLDMRSGVFVAENYRPYWPLHRRGAHVPDA